MDVTQLLSQERTDVQSLDELNGLEKGLGIVGARKASDKRGALTGCNKQCRALRFS